MEADDNMIEATVLKFQAGTASRKAPHPESAQGTGAVGLRDPLWRELAGAVLRSERTAQGRTLAQVADRAGVSPQYLSEVERGRKDPSSEMLESICGALGLRLVELLACSGRLLVGGHVSLTRPTGRPAGATMLAA